jgi:hypothetical protein
MKEIVYIESSIRKNLMRKYFLHTGNGQEGPLTLEEIRSKHLKHDTPVFYKGLEDWTHAGKIDELKDIVSTSNAPYFRESHKNLDIERPLPNSVGGLPAKRNKGKWALLFVVVIVVGLIAVLVYNQKKEKEVQATDNTVNPSK